MIKNYNQYIKESVLDKLEGPNEHDVWKALGFDNPITIEEYIKYILYNSVVTTKNTPHNIIYSYNYKNSEFILIFDNDKTIIIRKWFFKKFENLFDVSKTELLNILTYNIKKILYKKEHTVEVL